MSDAWATILREPTIIVVLKAASGMPDESKRIRVSIGLPSVFTRATCLINAAALIEVSMSSSPGQYVGRR